MKSRLGTRLLTFTLLIWSAALAKERSGSCWPGDKVPGAASLHGKYVNLLHVITVLEDKVEHGAFCDWGYWSGTEYGDGTNLKPGFWVYVFPKWYVWEKLGAEDKADKKASVNGKYRVLLHILNVPGDVSEYGDFHDHGFSEEYSYEGYENLTPGYWVYLEPNWYVWGEVKETCGGGT